MMNNINFIYALLDPKEINNYHIYIGKSNNPFRRYYEHINDQDGTYKVFWIKSLLKLGHNPELQILEQCNINNWEEKEKDWIKFYKQCGYIVVNSTEGGKSIIKRKFLSNEHKKHISESLQGNRNPFYGHRHSQDTKNKIGNIHKDKKYRLGKHWSEESKIKMIGNKNGKNNKGKILSKETKIKISQSKKGLIPWNKGLHTKGIKNV